MTNNARIAKNTLMLYMRMLLSLVLSLYTSRVVLRALGVEDFGIYSVVGGIVGLFGFLNSAMATSTQRYLTFALGREDEALVACTFTAAVRIHRWITLVVLMLVESVGIWFLYTHMSIPSGREMAALCVLQCSVVTAIVSITTVPYTALIIAHEHMSAFAYISVVEVLLRLLIALSLPWIPLDRLSVYAVLLLLVQVMVICVYRIYVKRHYVESRVSAKPDSRMVSEMLAFAGWNLWGNLSAVLSSQGINLLLNVFFGPAVNAARGLAVQVQCAVQQFATNFQMALNPQITKSFASGQQGQMIELVERSTKFTFFLLLALSLPMLIEAEFVLRLWLGDVPMWTISFLRVMLCVAVVESVANPLMTSAAASGRVRLYQSVVGSVLLLTLPLSYVVLQMGGNPVAVFWTQLLVGIVAFIVRLMIVRPLIKLSLSLYLRRAILPCLWVGSVSCVAALCFRWILPEMEGTSLLVIVMTIIFSIGASYGLGLTSAERFFLNEKIKKLVCR